MNGGAVHVLVHGVEPQPIHVEVAHPHKGVVAEKAAHLVASALFKVDGFSPRRAVVGGEVRAEAVGVVSNRTEVVVDDIEDHRKPVLVAGVDEALQGVRTTVAFSDGEERDTVIAPAEVAWELGDRHQLDVGDAEPGEKREALDGGVKGASLRKGAHVHLVKNGAAERGSRPVCVLPRKGILIVEL